MSANSLPGSESSNTNPSAKEDKFPNKELIFLGGGRFIRATKLAELPEEIRRALLAGEDPKKPAQPARERNDNLKVNSDDFIDEDSCGCRSGCWDCLPAVNSYANFVSSVDPEYWQTAEGRNLRRMNQSIERKLSRR